MDEQEFDIKLKELIKEIAQLPDDKQEQLTKLAEATQKRHKAIKMNVDSVQRSLNDLRLCVKYLVFDLEATRRERDHFKAIIDGNNDS